jgi:hypothetical protein
MTSPPPPPSREQAPSQGADPALLQRLWLRAELPGCVRHSQARAILGRHARMAGGLPLAELLLRRGHALPETSLARPVIVDARPADRALAPPRPQVRAMTPPRDAVPGIAQRSPVPAPAPPAAAPASPAPAPAAQATARPTGRQRVAASLPAVIPVSPARPSRPGTHAAGSTRQADARLSPASPPAQAPAAAPRPGTAAPAAPELPAAERLIAAARLGPGPAAMSREAGPARQASSRSRPVVRAGYSNGQQAADTTLAWPPPGPRQATRPGQAAGPARPPVLVVQEQVSLPGGLPPARLPVPWPAGATAPVLARTAPGLAAAPASGARDLARPGSARDQARRPPEQPDGRPADQGGRERDTERPAPPQIDMDRIVTTVQRRLLHHVAIERERRGMTR